MNDSMLNRRLYTAYLRSRGDLDGLRRLDGPTANALRGRIAEIPVSELAQKETLHQGWVADLKVETETTIAGVTVPVRYWLNRIGESDGATHAAEVEVMLFGKWIDLFAYGTPKP